MLWINEAEVAELLSMREAMDAVREALVHLASGDATNEPRRRVRTARGFLHMMAAADTSSGLAGWKGYAAFGGRARFFVQLFDVSTADPVALIEADRLGQIRTGAASGVAAAVLASPHPNRVGLIGTGWQAQTQLEAVVLATGARGAVVYGRNDERRRAFAARMSARLGIDVTPVESAEAAVTGSRIAISCTTSGAPVLKGAWCDPGTLVIAAGSNLLSRREIDGATVARAARIVVDSREQAKLEAGDLFPAIDTGRLHWSDVAELGDVLAGHTPGRRGPDEIIIFESLGLAIFDVAAGRVVVEKARAAGLGRELSTTGRSDRES